MCELMAICFERPVYADISMRSFAMRDVENADGWGLGWYPDQSLAIAKEPLTWRASEYAEFLQTYAHLHSHIYIGHVRNKTVGGVPTRADTHPFSRELAGREYCFAHNGTILTARRQCPSTRFLPVGATDSEQVFCHIIEKLAERQRWRREGGLSEEIDWRWLHRMFSAINELGKFNCLLSDGHRLFCYHDVNGFKGLWFCEMPANHHREAHHFDNVSLHVDFETEPANPGVAIATVPLGDEPGWRRFLPGEMIAVEGGRLVYSAEAERVAQPTPGSRDRASVNGA